MAEQLLSLSQSNMLEHVNNSKDKINFMEPLQKSIIMEDQQEDYSDNERSHQNSQIKQIKQILSDNEGGNVNSLSESGEKYGGSI